MLEKEDGVDKKKEKMAYIGWRMNGVALEPTRPNNPSSPSPFISCLSEHNHKENTSQKRVPTPTYLLAPLKAHR